VFDNHKDSIGKGGLADSSGHFKVYLHADKYELKVRSVGYTDFTLDKLQLRSGEIRQMEIRLGNGGGYKTIGIVSDKPLNKRALKRIEKRLERRTNNKR